MDYGHFNVSTKFPILILNEQIYVTLIINTETWDWGWRQQNHFVGSVTQ